MQPINEHTGTAMVLARDDVDTDQIIPAEYCRKVTRTGFADALFARWRADPGFALNDPNRAGATILVAQRNFGTGSSREHAVWALWDWGFVCVIASSFGDIFRSNAPKNGVVPIELPDDAVTALAEAAQADSTLQITVDLQNVEVRYGTSRVPFEFEPWARSMLLNGFDDIDLTLDHEYGIDCYEIGRPRWLPKIGPALLEELE
ncbi:3-isopropylmalate dehydratase small subunit [Lentzea tibetensis]|uniref:3-isopropylmalate dehydratase small subunit n=1 Tax=Lentzea tibetensis TaxID=2591470 RepID=A0A563EFT9_9PSEU|nr:3-isopropylmalate dehydratase small subunit [Lentzea tibetensis]TWP44950.1 3-isopropylmalate dehydratase small subunit [Lentzea tibetensis]